jgi:hypothetical protein
VYPIKENIREASSEGTVIEKVPSAPEITPVVVPSITIFTPGSASLVAPSVTVPETDLSCANRFTLERQQIIPKNKRRFFFIEVGLD